MSNTKAELEKVGIVGLRKRLNEVAYSKSVIAEDEKKADATKHKNQKKLISNLIKKDKKYEKYKIRNKAELDDLKSPDKVIKLIMELDKLPNLEQSDYELGVVKRGKRAEQSDAIINNVKRISDEPPSAKGVKELDTEVDLLVEIDKEEPSEENKARIKEVGELALEKVGQLYRSEKKEELKAPLVKLFEKIINKLPSSIDIDETELVTDKEEFETLVKKNRLTQAEMGQAFKARREAAAAAAAPTATAPTAVKDPATGMEVKTAPTDTAAEASASRASGVKTTPKKKEVKKEASESEEEKKEEYIPIPTIGTNYSGTEKRLQSQNEVNGPLQTHGDTDLGNVRELGFLGPMTELAKVDDVTLPESERSKSLKRFTNFRWVQSIQNSDLGYASPFQRMDDIDNRRRFTKCFMHVNTLPKNVETQDEIDKAKSFNTYELTPSYNLSSVMQPAGHISFVNSTSKLARRITSDEFEPINQGKRNVNNVKNTLEFPNFLKSDDPLQRIKDKYKKNIVC